MSQLQYAGIFLYKSEQKQFIKLLETLPFLKPALSFPLNNDTITNDIRTNYVGGKMTNNQFESYSNNASTGQELIYYIFQAEDSVYFYIVISRIDTERADVSTLRI